MADPISMSVVIGMLVKSAPGWFQSVQETFLSKGKEAALARGKAKIQGFLDERKHLRHMELALRNAAERGLKGFHTLEERDRYRSVLQFLSESDSEGMRYEAMQLFTLSDSPDLTTPTEKYNLRHRVSAFAHHEIYEDIDASAYLNSFFEALIAELYNDPLFRAQMSDVIKVRAALKGQQSLEDIVAILSDISNTISNTYTVEQFQQDIDTYISYVEAKFRHHKFVGIVFRADEDKAPDLDSIYVPQRIVLRDQNIVEKEMDDNYTFFPEDQSYSDPRGKKYNDLLFLLEQSSYLILLGGPGSGKSTTTRYLAWSYAKVNAIADSKTPLLPLSKHSEVLQGKPVPLRIELRLLSEARKQNVGYSFLTYVTEVMLGREDVFIHPQMFKELLERRVMLLLFDGLDEVVTLAERQQLVSDIESFAQMYPGNRILVTSRPVGYDLASFVDRSFHQCEIQGFNDKQIKQFLESWYTQVLKYSPLPRDVQQELEAFYSILKQNERLHRLAETPLLLTVMTALHRYERLPDERVLIYEKCADLLLDTWAKLKYQDARWKDMKMGKQDRIACLAHLGFVLHESSQEAEISNNTTNRRVNGSNHVTAVDVPESFIRREIKRFLANQNLLAGAEQNTEAELFLELVRIEAGLIVARGTDETGETLYGFVHRTFQEYFAAVDVFERYQQEDDSKIIRKFLKDHLHEPHWREVILLLFGKLKHKFATAQLRGILEGKSRLSIYAEVVKQDLFFVCDCLIEGITVETSFAKQIVSQVIDLVRTSNFPSQHRRALYALVSLLRTHQYVDLGLQELEAFFTEEAIDTSIQIEVARNFYWTSSKGSKEEREGAKLLLALGQREDLSVEQLIQVAQAFYRISPRGSKLEREGARMLLARARREDLSVEQLIQVVQLVHQVVRAFYRNSPEGSIEEQEEAQLLLREGARMLLALGQQEDLSVEQLIQLAEAIYRNSPKGSKEEREGAKLLLALGQREDLSVEQLIQVAQAFYRISPRGSKLEREGARMLLARARREDLSVEQLIQVAQAIHENSPERSKEWQEGVNMLLALGQQKDLSVEQLIQVTRAFYRNSPEGSIEEQEEAQLLLREGARMLLARARREDLSVEQLIQMIEAIHWSSYFAWIEEREGAKLLLALGQREDLSVEQLIQVARTVNLYHPFELDEGQVGVRLLLARARREDLSVEQLIQVVQVAWAFYQRSSVMSEEEQEEAQLLLQEGVRMLLARARREDLSVEQLIQVAEAIYRNSPKGSKEKREGAKLLLALGQQEDLSVEQLIQVAETIYQKSAINSQLRQFASQVIKKLLRNQNLPVENRLQVAKITLKAKQNNFRDRAETLQILLTMMKREEIELYLEENWQKLPFSVEKELIPAYELHSVYHYEAFIPEIPFIVYLVKQDVLSISIRDGMYQLLSDMVPLFGRIKITGSGLTL